MGECNEVQTGFWPPILPPRRLEFLTRPCWDCWYGNTLSAAWGRYTGISLVLEKKWYWYTYVKNTKKQKYILFSSNMSRKSWVWDSGITLFIISSDTQWMESDLGVKTGGCNEVQTGFWPPILPPKRLEFLTRPCWDYWYGNTLSAAWGRYTGITLVLEKKWYTYVIHAKKAKIHAFQQQHVPQVMGLSFWSHPFYSFEWSPVDGIR